MGKRLQNEGVRGEAGNGDKRINNDNNSNKNNDNNDDGDKHDDKFLAIAFSFHVKNNV